MLIEKEVIAPGSYWYMDEKSGLPRKLDVTPELTKYWQEQGNKMLATGLTVPVPCEHDFTAHPMTPKDKLLNNAGWVREYVVKDAEDGRKNVLFAATDILDEEVYKKLPNTIKYTSPWINSFTDGNGNQWNNVISHLALTTRPRITQQSPFPSIAAALSMASEVKPSNDNPIPQEGFFLSRATRLVRRKSDNKIVPQYPMAFSLITGISLAEGDIPPKKKPPTPPMKSGDGKESGSGDKPPTGESSEFENPDGSGIPKDADPTNDDQVDLPPLGSKQGDVSMSEVLCDLLRALGVNVELTEDEGQFKRNLYAAAMQKVHELTNKGMNKEEQPKPGTINQGKPPGSPQAGGNNPIIQQEQQPMYMSLEDINKIVDPTLKSFALSVYNDKVVSDAKVAEAEKVINSLRDGKLKEAGLVRNQRIAILSKVSPKVKSDLEAMLSLPSMAMSMGEGGQIIDPMDAMLSILEKGLGDVPKLLTTPSSALSVASQPTDENMLNEEEEASIVDSLSRMAGAPPQSKKAS